MMMKTLRIFLLCFSLSINLSKAQVQVSRDSIVDWHICGMNPDVDPTGYPVYNILSYGSANDASTAFENAFDQITPPAIIDVPAGTYDINTAVYIPSDFIIRGAGAGNTIFEINTPSGAEFRDGFRLQGKPERIKGDCRRTSTINTITHPVTGSYQKGDLQIAVPDASIYVIGGNIELQQENDPNEITDDASWADFCKGQMLVIKNIQGNTLILDRSLTQDYFGNIEIRKFEPVENIGLESFTIENVSPSYNSNIGMEWAVNCYIKCVESKMCDRDHIRIDRSRNIEVSGCYINSAHSHGAGGFGYGLRLSDHSSECLIENNICRHLRHGLLVKEGSTRNVYGYNYVREGYYSDGNHFPADISLHGHWANMTLFEGNIVGRITISDAWGRTGPGNLIFRNRSERSWHISVEELSHDQILIGNEMIEPYLRRSNGQYFCGSSCASEAPGYCDQNWCGGVALYEGECLFRSCHSSPNPEYITLYEEPGILRTIRYSNQNFFGFVDANEPIPKSYYQCTRPSFFGAGDQWPSIGPEFGIGTGTIPARKRWADYESSGNLADLFPNCFCDRAMEKPSIPQEFSLCSAPPVTIESGVSASNNFEWYKDFNVLAGETNPDLIITDSALYGLRLTSGTCAISACTKTIREIYVDLGPDLILCSPTSHVLIPIVNGAGLDYSWNTGATSDSLLVTTPGTYTVSVSSPLCNAVNDQIDISSSTQVPIDDLLACGGGTATLTTQSGAMMNWYDASTGGNLVHTGTTYNPNVSVSTTFWVEESGGSHSFSVGPLLNDLVPGFSPGTRNPNDVEDGRTRFRMDFNTSRTVVINSVDIYLRSTNTNTHNLVISVEDKNGNIVPGTVVNYPFSPPSTGYQLVRVPLNISVPPGKDYSLSAMGSDNGALQWQYFDDGGVYPYTDANNIVEITKSWDTYCENTEDPVTYFFDWQVSLPDQLCDRVPVMAIVDSCASTPDCNGDPNGTATIDSCGICSGGLTGIIPNSSCRDCNNDINGAAYLDSCGVCVGGNTSLTPCTQSCDGVWGGSSYFDSCGVCVGGNTTLTPCTQDCNSDWGGTAFIDSCGICVAGSTGLTPCTPDCNGDFGGTAFIDSCGVCAGGNTPLTPCTQDCNGDWGGTASMDSCGICAGGLTGNLPNSSCRDCNNNINGTAIIDSCGVCSGGLTGIVPNSTCLDCNGDINGTASIDACGICSGGLTGIVPNSTCLDCNGDINGSASIDSCGICSGGLTGVTPNSTCLDCNGSINGSAYLDSCGICVGGTTGNLPCGPDCNGDNGGSAYLDNCGVCVAGNTGLTPCTQDCNGDFGGSAFTDSCGVCAGGLTGIVPNSTCLDCNGDFNGTAFIDSCGICVGGNTSLTPCTQTCDGVWGGSSYIDSCGTCVGGTTGNLPCGPDCNGDNGGSAFIDGCGVCAGGLSGIVPNSSCLDCNGDINGSAFIDSCGVCVAGNTSLTPCTQTCDGVWGGNAYFDSCGICVGGTTGNLPCGPDCNGDNGGSAFIDGCGVCAGGLSGIVPNSSCLDCNGDVNGSAFVDSCGICVGGNTGLILCTLDCNGDWGGTAFIDSCGICVGGNTSLTLCTPDCNGDWGGNYIIDICGNCVDSLDAGLNCEVLVPNSFTPNGDGYNDLWEITGLDAYPEARLFVYNRWGMLIYRTTAKKPYWDGKRNGDPMPAATYYFLLDLKDADPVNGSVTIVY